VWASAVQQGQRSNRPLGALGNCNSVLQPALNGPPRGWRPAHDRLRSLSGAARTKTTEWGGINEYCYRSAR
jgi:hypothetical protein